MIPKSSTIAVMKENRKKRKTPMMNRGLWFKMGLLFILITFFMPVVNASKKDLTESEKEAHKKRLLETWKHKPMEKTGKRKKMMEIMKQNEMDDDKEFNCDVCKKLCKSREAKKTGCKNDHKGHKECIDHWHEEHVKKHCPVCNNHGVATRPKRDDEHWLKFHALQRIGVWGSITAVAFAVLDVLYWSSVVPTTYASHYPAFLNWHFGFYFASYLIIVLLNLVKNPRNGTTILMTSMWDFKADCGGCMLGSFLWLVTLIAGPLIYDKLIPGSGRWTKFWWTVAFGVQLLFVRLINPSTGAHGEAPGEFDYLFEMYR